MHFLSCLRLLALLSLGTLQVEAQYGAGDAADVDVPVAPAAPTEPQAGGVSNLQTETVLGDTQCGSAMCVTATVNTTTSTVEYKMSAVSSAASTGWMAMGFGRSMANTPMVIMWLNADGTTTISQRQASGQTMPRVAAQPPRVATLVDAPPTAAGSLPTFTYTIPTDSDTTQRIIWAVGPNPSSTDPAATIAFHSSYGSLTLNLANVISGDAGGAGETDVTPSPTQPGGSDGQNGGSTALFTARQNMIIAHAALCLAGFLLFLPAGALLARLGRTFTRSWFLGHWVFQFGIAMPIIIAGVSLGFAAVQNVGGAHATPGHKLLGLILFGLYLVQCGLGGIIHFVKSKKSTRRPPQNYVHAVLGIAIIALSFFQVRTGYNVAWRVSGLDPFPKPVDYFWIGWMVIIPLAYFGGLALLPRQWKQERESSLGIGKSDDTELFHMASPNGSFSNQSYRKGDEDMYSSGQKQQISTYTVGQDYKGGGTNFTPQSYSKNTFAAYGAPEPNYSTPKPYGGASSPAASPPQPQYGDPQPFTGGGYAAGGYHPGGEQQDHARGGTQY